MRDVSVGVGVQGFSGKGGLESTTLSKWEKRQFSALIQSWFHLGGLCQRRSEAYQNV